MRFDNPIDIAIDGNGKLWVAEGSMQPKRVSRWTRDGKIEKWFLGPAVMAAVAPIGGGAWMDAHDRSVVIFDGMKFIVNWQDYSWKLDSILYRPGVNGPARSAAPNRAVYLQGRRYLVGDPRVRHEIAVICTEKNGVAVPIAAAGTLGAWSELDKYPGFKAAFKELSRRDAGSSGRITMVTASRSWMKYRSRAKPRWARLTVPVAWVKICPSTSAAGACVPPASRRAGCHLRHQ